MKQLLLLIFAGLFFSSIGQTKLIFHKSHSGNSKTFLSGIKQNNSNFGMAPTRTVRNSKLDSVILLDDYVAVMVTSEYCTEFEYGSDRGYGSSLWSAGKDTVYNHPLFNKEKSMEQIRKTLKDEYFFANDISTVKLIGFDKKTKDDYTILEPNFEPDEREKLIRNALNDRAKTDDLEQHKKRRKFDPLLKWFIFGWLTIFLNESY